MCDSSVSDMIGVTRSMSHSSCYPQNGLVAEGDDLSVQVQANKCWRLVSYLVIANSMYLPYRLEKAYMLDATRILDKLSVVSICGQYWPVGSAL